MGIGCKHLEWTKELDNKMINGISNGKNLIGLAVILNTSVDTIKRRLKDLGFTGIRDARINLQTSRKKHML